jgi:uncharacterized membrane protein
MCQLAVVGFAAVDMGFRIYPFPEAYEGLTSVTAHDALVEQGAMSQLFLWIGLAEIIGTVALTQMLEGSGRQAGDFGFGSWMLEDMSEEQVADCRLAMMAFSGMVTGAVLTQGPFPYV